MPNPLGICTHQPTPTAYPCGGDLCISTQGLDAQGNPIADGQDAVKVRRVVRCEECGNIMEGHDATRGEGAPPLPPEDITKAVRIDQFASSERDRIGKLEKTVAKQGELLDKCVNLINSLTAKAPERAVKRTG